MAEKLLIDGDQFLYRAAAAVETEVRWDEDNHVLFSNYEEALDVFWGLVNKLDKVFPGNEKYLAFTGTNLFRTKLSPSYKGGRSRKPLCYSRMLETILELPNARRYEGLEADDVLGIWATGKLKGGIIVSEDKDLKTIPGRLYRQDEVVKITEDEANYQWMWQTLNGDTTDGYPGCPGIGAVKAGKVLASAASTSVADMWMAVVEAFGDPEEALLQARMARILRAEDWNSKTKEVILWTP